MTGIRIAYLVSQYPAASHTFIRREVASLRAHGLDIQTFSIRRPSAGETRAPLDRIEADKTWYVLAAGAPRIAAANLIEAVLHPVRWLSTLWMAMGHRAPGIRAFIWSLFHFAESIVLARELRRRRIDRLHNHFANAGATVGVLAARHLKLPWSLTLHGISETDYPAGLTLPAKIEAATFVACVSWFGRAQAMRITPPLHWQKMQIVRCGVDLGDDVMQPRPTKTTRDRPQIICVARLSPEKGLVGLLGALNVLDAKGIHSSLTLLGDGPQRDALEELARALGIEDRVEFLGRLDERATLAAIADADLLVLPSFMEGLPVVLMEAMALGVPVIASRVAGIPELVEDGVEGLLFCPADWNDLAEKISAVLSDDSRRKRMVDAARKTVEESFDVRRAVLPLIDMFGREGPSERSSSPREKKL